MARKWWVFYVPGEEWERQEYVRDVSESECWWTCHEETLKGDFAVLYARKPISAIVAIMHVTSDARHEPNEFTVCPWACDIECESILDKPLTFSRMRSDSQLAKHWGLVRANFQPPRGGPPQIDPSILRLLSARIPELKAFVQKKSAK
jgi:hypothetical protein